MNLQKNISHSFQWKKGFFSDTYKVFSEDTLLFTLKENPFTQKALAIINGHKYGFQTKGILKHNTGIIDKVEDKVIGNITYNTWKSKAEITLNNQIYTWQYDNVWCTKWSLLENDKVIIKGANSTAKGKIESNSDNDLLLLTALFVHSYFVQMSAVGTVV